MDRRRSFFVISGFLIAGILLDTKGDTGYFRNFYARRMLRIFPLYYLFVVTVLIAFSHNPEFRAHAGSPLWYLLYLGNVPEGLLGLSTPYWLAPVWSLAIEEQFYLTFPWIVRLLDRRRLTILLVAMIVIAPIIRLVTMLAWPDNERVQYLFTLCRIDTIAIGCLLAVVVRAIDIERWRKHARLLAIGLLPSMVLLAIASHLDRRSPFDRVFGYSIVAVGCAAVVSLVILSRDSKATSALRTKPLTYLGKLCFGLYLLHRPADTVVSAIAARLRFHHDLWLLLPKIGVAVAFATVSWRLIERPFLKLKARFATAGHPNVATHPVAPPALLPAFVNRVLRMIGILVVLIAVGCRPGSGNVVGNDGTIADGALQPGEDAPPREDAPSPEDARWGDAPPWEDAPHGGGDAGLASDAALPVAGVVIYPEGSRHSPITDSMVTRLQAIASSPSQANVFAKVGDSITVAASFLACFDGGTVDFAGRSDLSSTVSYFMSGNAAGTPPFDRNSLAAKGGTTARDAMTGSPTPLDQELSAITPRVAIVMFGTNEARFDWTIDEFGTHLWNLIDATIASGVVPIMSTISANTGYPAADARIPTFNRVVRAIAQGRGVPLVDFHRELDPLPDRGISSDGIHPTVSPSGGCVLSSAGLQYGYNIRNLITLEALGRTRSALLGTASDAMATVRTGSGTEGDPYVSTFPLVDLGDTRTGGAHIDHGCGVASGHEVAYRLSVPSPMTLDAFLVDRPGTDVDVRIVSGGTCLVAGDATVTANVPAGVVEVLVDARSANTEGEFLLIVQPH